MWARAAGLAGGSRRRPRARVGRRKPADDSVWEKRPSRRWRRLPLRPRRRRPWPDPCSRCSRTGGRALPVVDPTRFDLATSPPGVRLVDLVLYELHVGTFTPRGHVRRRGSAPAGAARARDHRDRADARRDRSPATAAGATTASTRTRRTRPTAAPGLARLVDAAHRDGLGVILDVVYNHVGRLRGDLPRSGRNSTDRHRLSGGAATRRRRSAASASGRSRTRSCGRATTASTACASTRCTPSSTSEPHVLKELKDRSTSSSSPRWDRTTSLRSRSGDTTRSGRTCCTAR